MFKFLVFREKIKQKENTFVCKTYTFLLCLTCSKQVGCKVQEMASSSYSNSTFHSCMIFTLNSEQFLMYFNAILNTAELSMHASINQSISVNFSIQIHTYICTQMHTYTHINIHAYAYTYSTAHVKN